jgi:hypothetical protein
MLAASAVAPMPFRTLRRLGSGAQADGDRPAIARRFSSSSFVISDSLLNHFLIRTFYARLTAANKTRITSQSVSIELLLRINTDSAGIFDWVSFDSAMLNWVCLPFCHET